MLPPDIKLFCLTQSGKPLSQGTHNALIEAAVRMVRNDRRQLFMRSKDSSGLVETDLEPVEWCGMYGMQFTANLLMPKGYTGVKFFMRTDVLENFDINNTMPGTIIPAHAVPFPLPPGIPPNTPVIVCPVGEDDFDDDDDEDNEDESNGFGPFSLN